MYAIRYFCLHGILKAPSSSHKAHDPHWHQIFLRGIGCNWLVSVAVWVRSFLLLFLHLLTSDRRYNYSKLRVLKILSPRQEFPPWRSFHKQLTCLYVK